MNLIRRWLWYRRNRDFVRRFNEYTGECPCCGGPIDLLDSNTLWWTIGSGYAICKNHPQSNVWPQAPGEHRFDLILPLANWTAAAKSSWAANEPPAVLTLCGIPVPKWADDLR